MSNSAIPVIAGLVVGVALIVTMIFVGESIVSRYGTDLGHHQMPYPPGVIVPIIEVPDNTGVFIIDNSGNELNEDPYGLLEENNNSMGAIVLGGPDDVDSGTDQVLPSITLDDGVILTLK